MQVNFADPPPHASEAYDAEVASSFHVLRAWAIIATVTTIESCLVFFAVIGVCSVTHC